MKSLIEMEKQISSIARRSSFFKIGETGNHEFDRLIQHHTKYREVKVITWSIYSDNIDWAEERMIDRFINWKNCDNKKGGSAGNMKKSKKYILYVIFTLKKK